MEVVFWWAGGSERIFWSPRRLPRLVPRYINHAEQDWEPPRFCGKLLKIEALLFLLFEMAREIRERSMRNVRRVGIQQSLAPQKVDAID